MERILLGQEALVNEVRTWLDEEDTADAMVEAAIRSSGDDRMNTLRGLSPARIFGRGAIRDLCVRYRLRFLPSALYKAEILARPLAPCEPLRPVLVRCFGVTTSWPRRAGSGSAMRMPIPCSSCASVPTGIT